jgi:hypothetical protein
MGIDGVQALLRAILCIRTVDREGREIAASLYATRVDVPIDGAPFTIQQLTGWLDDGLWLSRGRKLTVETARNPFGSTVYAGAKKSDRRLCAYDRRGYVRVEYRAKDVYADALMGALMLGPLHLRRAAQAQISGWVDSAKSQPAIEGYKWLVDDAEPAPNARAQASGHRRQRAPGARLSAYVERMLPYVRLWLLYTGASPASIADWPLSPRAQMTARVLGLTPEVKTPSSANC